MLSRCELADSFQPESASESVYPYCALEPKNLCSILRMFASMEQDRYKSAQLDIHVVHVDESTGRWTNVIFVLGRGSGEEIVWTSYVRFSEGPFFWCSREAKYDGLRARAADYLKNIGSDVETILARDGSYTEGVHQHDWY